MNYAPPIPPKKPIYRRVWFWVVSGVVALIVIGSISSALAGNSSKTDTDVSRISTAATVASSPAAAAPSTSTPASTTAASNSAPPPSPTATGPVVHQFGDIYNYSDGMTISVANLTDQTTWNNDPATSVDVVVGNNTAKDYTVNLFSATVDMQAAGRQATWSILDSQTLDGDVLPGQTLIGTYWFQGTQTGQITVIVEFHGQKTFWTTSR